MVGDTVDPAESGAPADARAVTPAVVCQAAEDPAEDVQAEDIQAVATPGVGTEVTTRPRRPRRRPQAESQCKARRSLRRVFL